MSFLAFELTNNDWYMLEGRFDTVAEAQTFIDEQSKKVSGIQKDFKEPVNPGVYKIVDEKDTVAKSAIITVANATLYRVAWSDVNVGSNVFIFNPKNNELPRWGVKNSLSTSKHGNKIVNFDASYEYFSSDDKYSVDWQENMDALWARAMKEEAFQPKQNTLPCDCTGEGFFYSHDKIIPIIDS